MAFNEKDIQRQIKLMEKLRKSQKGVFDESKAYFESVKMIGEMQAQIDHLVNSQTVNTQRLVELNAEITAGGVTAARLTAINNEIAAIAQQNIQLAAAIPLEEARRDALIESTNAVNKLGVGLRAVGKAWDNIPKYAEKTYKWVKSMEALDMSKGIKDAELSMGILSNQSKFFSKTMSDASKSTIQIGVGVKDLAKAQADYSESIGRSMMLSEDGYKAISEMARGTKLGIEGAAEMAASMESFGLSVESSRDVVEETVDASRRMGTNATKTVKELGRALKLAQKYHFKGGVKAMAEMASYASKIGMDMEDISSMAEKVFRPEGAVEMAAKMATLGGEFAKLGDPFELMFKARNDFAGFAKDVGAAAAEFAQYNEKTGEFDITGVQLDRIRELSEVTGLSVDNLTKMAREGAKFNKIKTLVPSVLSDEDKDLVSALSEFDKDSGKWQLKVGDGMKFVDELTATDVAQRRGEKESLEKRAKQAQTFDDAFNNLIMQFKTMGLPLIESLNDYLVTPLIELQQDMASSGFIDSAKELASTIGKIVGVATKFIVEHPVASIITYLTGKAFFNAAQWIANGRYLATGFNASTVTPGRALAQQTATGTPMSLTNRMLGGNVMGGRLAAGTVGSMAAGAGLGIAGMGLSYGGDKLKESGHENWGTAAKIAGSAASGAGMGMMLGPWGAAIGGLLGAAYGAYNEFSDKGEAANQQVTQINDGVVKFNPQDKFLKMDDGVVASTQKGKLDDVMGKRGGSGGKTKVTFDDLTIKGEIVLKNANGTTIDRNVLDDPFFLNEITKMIQQQLSINISGGKLNPNPS